MSKRPKITRRPAIPGHVHKPPAAKGNSTWLFVGMAVVAVLIAAAIAVTSSKETPEEEAELDDQSQQILEGAYGDRPVSTFQAVSITGDPLSDQEEVEKDTAIGEIAPRVKGADFVGDPVSIGQGPSMILFAAHWCEICQNEVPEVARYLDTGLLPDGVSATLVSTSTKEMPGLAPPPVWVASTAWNLPVLVDNRDSAAMNTYGLKGFPMFVFINEDGEVTQRRSGALTREEIKNYLSEIDPSKK